MPGGEEKEEEILEDIVTEKSPQINVRRQTRDPGSLESNAQNKYPPNKNKRRWSGISYSSIRKSKIKKNLERSQKNTPPYL